MISKLGNFLELLAMLLSSIAIIGSLPIVTKCCKIPKLPLLMLWLSVTATALAFLLLIYGFISSDFSVQNVFLNSSTIKPLIFKVAGAWASHEGSMLLWFSLLNIVGLTATLISPNYTINQYQIRIIACLQLLFGSFIYFTSNPFIGLSFKPSEGLGLNPVLQDIALAIHPPILYLGYVSYIVPFISACTILLKPHDEIIQLELFKLAKTFSSFALAALSLGVGLGSWWAYRELGWGGFWFFDPVENISLMPWLAGIALHHSLIITVKSKRLVNWTLTLAIITFLLSLIGMFLVRSGMLTSVHSFAFSPKRAGYLLAIVLLISLASSLLLILRFNKINFNKAITFKEKGIIASNIVWLISLAILLIATIYPIAYFALYNESISISYQFFVNSFVPSILPIFLLAGVFSSNSKNRRHLIIATLTTIIVVISSYKLKYGLISILMVAGAIFLILQTIHILLIKSEYFSKKLSTGSIAMVLGHLGFGLLALSITLNALLQQEMDFIGKIGESVVAGEFKISLKDVKLAQGTNYYHQTAEFWLEDLSNNNITILKPENRLYIIEQTLSQESDIYSYLSHDLYAVLNKIDGDILHAKIYYRPVISLVWLSVIIIVAGFLVSLSKFSSRKIIS